MEKVLAVIAALVLWRLVVAVAIATAVAVALAFAMPEASPVLVVGILILGAAGGTLWQSRAAFPPAPTQTHPSVAWPVAFLGLAFAGLIWGGLLEFVTNSEFVAFAVLAATPFLAGPAVVAVTKRQLTARQLLFGSIASSSGYAALYVVQTIASHSGA